MKQPLVPQTREEAMKELPLKAAVLANPEQFRKHLEQVLALPRDRQVAQQ